MKRLSIAAIVVALLSAGMSGWALWRSYDTDSSEDDDLSTSTTLDDDQTTTTTIPIVEVPTVVGKNGFFAGLSLKNAGLDFRVVNTPSVNVEKGKVISQNPLPDTEVPEGSVITITLSSGPPGSGPP